VSSSNEWSAPRIPDSCGMLISLRCISALLLFLFTMVSSSECQTIEDSVIQVNREIGLSFEPSSIAYREYVDGAVQDSEHGWIAGFGVNESIMVDALGVKDVLLEATYDFNTGSSDHRSKSLTGGNPLSYSAPFKSNDVWVGIGKGFLPMSKLVLTPESGFEYREWLRKLPLALLAIRENYTFWAPGAALSANYELVHALVLKARVGADYTISPTLNTIGNPAGQVPNLAFELGNRPVWRAEVGADAAITHSVHAFANVDYSHFGFGKSAVAHFGLGGSEYEPNSVTDLTKVRVGMAWSF
jgi:hypothetical protein